MIGTITIHGLPLDVLEVREYEVTPPNTIYEGCIVAKVVIRLDKKSMDAFVQAVKKEQIDLLRAQLLRLENEEKD